MKPFHRDMYPDDIVLRRTENATGTRGATGRTFPGDPVESIASVQTERADRTDAMGRAFTVTVHKIYTPTNLAAVSGDRIEWLGRTLAVEAGTVPKGIGNVTWLTHCLESK